MATEQQLFTELGQLALGTVGLRKLTKMANDCWNSKKYLAHLQLLLPTDSVLTSRLIYLEVVYKYYRIEINILLLVLIQSIFGVRLFFKPNMQRPLCCSFLVWSLIIQHRIVHELLARDRQPRLVHTVDMRTSVSVLLVQPVRVIVGVLYQRQQLLQFRVVGSLSDCLHYVSPIC